MTQAKDSGRVRKGFSAVAKMIEEVEAKGKLYGVPPEAVLAVIVKESYGSMWFCACDAQYKDNMRTVKAFTGLKESEYLDLIKIRKGPNKGAIPKFRLEPSWSKAAENECRKLADRKGWKFRLMSSFGLAQKGMVWHLAAKNMNEWESAFWAFVEDPYLQIEVCAHDLATLWKKTPGDWHTVFSRYNGGGKMKGITDYSEKVVSMMQQFSQ